MVAEYFFLTSFPVPLLPSCFSFAFPNAPPLFKANDVRKQGKRKAAAKKPTGPRKNEPLPTVFACLFCNHEKSVTIKLDKKAGVGHLSCKICNQRFQCAVNYLSAGVDVYSDWVDACDAVAKQDGEELDTSFAVNRSTATREPVALNTSRARQSSQRGNLGNGPINSNVIDDDDDDY